MNAPARSILLLVSRDAAYPFDAYLEEILLVEGYNAYEARCVEPAEAVELTDYPLVLISAGAARVVGGQAVQEYVDAGGRAVIIQPPRDWAPIFGLAPATELYSVARDAYLQVNMAHPWFAGFPMPDLQVPGEAHVYAVETAEPLAFVAGQRGRPSIFPAVALSRQGQGAAVVFTYDLAETVVRLHQGRPELSSTGADPDANRDGKFTPDDAFVGQRDYELRHVPQADVHQDLLVRLIRGLLEDRAPLPRLWHFPHAAPAVLFIDGDGDGMTWEDLEWVVRETTRTGTKYTLYMMTSQIESFDPERIAVLRQQGYEFGVHPWVSLKPDLQTWRQCLCETVALFARRFGFAPRSIRAHCCIFPGWDETPQLLAELGLRLDTDFIAGYRFVSGYLNGSALPVKFISRDGQVIDCYSQSTVQTEDGSCTPKCLLPPMTEQEALALALELLDECTHRWHGVFHPYFHPISLAGRTGVPCQTWFRQLLRRARDLGLPSVNASEWLDFNDARRAVVVEGPTWEEGAVICTLRAHEPVAGLTLLLPPHGAQQPAEAVVDGERWELLVLNYEGLLWHGLVLDLPAETTTVVRVCMAPKPD